MNFGKKKLTEKTMCLFVKVDAYKLSLLYEKKEIEFNYIFELIKTMSKSKQIKLTINKQQ